MKSHFLRIKPHQKPLIIANPFFILSLNSLILKFANS